MTLGFGEIVPLFFKNLSSVTFSLNLGPINIQLQNQNWTGGVQGINPIDPPYIPFFNIIFDARSGQLAVYLGLFLLLDRDPRRPQPRALAHRPSLGRPPRGRDGGRDDGRQHGPDQAPRVRAGASFAGVAGSFQASYLGASTSDFFYFSISILVLIMVILGGIGNIWGAVFGAFALTYVDKTLLPYIGQRIGDVAPSIPNPAEYNFLIFGVILVRHDAVQAQGFLPSRQREAELIVAGLSRTRSQLGLPTRRRARQHRARAARPERGRPGRPRRRDPRRGPTRMSMLDLPSDIDTGAMHDAALLVKSRAVTKRFGGLLAVNNVDFDIPRGSIVSLIGPNGAGKTTFFNMITGYYVPTSGDIIFDGHAIVTMKGKKAKSLKPHEVTALGIGRTFQNIRLFGTMSALDNVKVGINVHLKSHWWDSVVRTPCDAPRGEAARSRSAWRLLKLVELDKRSRDVGAQPALRRPAPARDRPGPRDRPKLLLLDEPTAGMNRSETRQMTDFIQRLRATSG